MNRRSPLRSAASVPPTASVDRSGDGRDATALPTTDRSATDTAPTPARRRGPARVRATA